MEEKISVRAKKIKNSKNRVRLVNLRALMTHINSYPKEVEW